MEFCRYYSLVKPIFAQRDLRSVSSINEHTRVCTCTAKTKKIFFYFLATLCSTWKCLASTWGWNVASKHCCSFTGKDIADRVKDNISTVARRPRARSIQPKFPEISVQYSKDRFGPTGKVSKKLVHLLRWSSFPGRTGLNFGWMDRALASPQTSVRVRLSRIQMNAWQTNPNGRLRGG